MIKIDYLIPLIGSFYIAVNNLISNKFNINHGDIYSYNIFNNNEQHFINNYNVNIKYIDNNENIKSNNNDILCCIPPCGGLSQLNRNLNEYHYNNSNKYIIKCVNFYKNNNYKVLLLENAPGLIGKYGISLLNIIKNILGNKYKITIIKTNTMNHGIPQNRKRCFLIVYKHNNFYKIINNINNIYIGFEEYIKKLNLNNGINIGNDYTDELINCYNNNINLFNNYQYLSIAILDNYNKINLNIYNKLKKEIDRILIKINNNKRYWMEDLLLHKNILPSLTSKSKYILHPNNNRILFLEELLYIMGMPNNFKLNNYKKNLNHIFQAIPITTAMDALKWCINIINNNYKEISINSDWLFQNNLNNDMNNSVYYYKNNNCYLLNNKRSVL